LEFDLGGEGGLGQVEQGGDHLAGLVGVVVDGLLAQQDRLAPSFLKHGGQGLGGGEGRISPSSLTWTARSRRRPGRCAGFLRTWRRRMVTAMISVILPFSFRRTASSMAISS